MGANISDSEISRVLTVLSEPTRIRIIRSISSAGEMRSCDLLPEFDITQPTLSHHLNVLLENGVLSSRKDGRCIYYSVNRSTMILVAQLMEAIASGRAAKPSSVVPKTEKTVKSTLTVKVEKDKKDKKDKKDRKNKDKDKKKKKKDKSKKKKK